MGFISREQFLEQQAKRSAQNSNHDENSVRIPYFKLENDNDEALVRFIYAEPEQMYKDIILTHKTTLDGKFRRVNCLRDFQDPISACPFCEAGEQVQQRFYVKLIQYTVDKDTGEVTSATPKVWERQASFVSTLEDKFQEYGNLQEFVYKVRRHGAPKYMKTTYSVDLANPTIYNSSRFQADFSAFDSYKLVGGPVLNKTAQELKEMLGTPAAPTTTAPRKVTY